MIKNRIGREKATLEKMFRIYCDKNHYTPNLCEDCRGLLDYALDRLDKCPFGYEKPTCKNCHVHCYRKSEREKIRDIMRFSGPKMIYKSPYLALMHIIDGRKNLKKKIKEINY
jgi:hypothetical protein